MTIAELLNAEEGENVEFKEAKNSFEFDTLVKYVCAVSNHGGGRVVFGITENLICSRIVFDLCMSFEINYYSIFFSESKKANYDVTTRP